MCVCSSPRSEFQLKALFKVIALLCFLLHRTPAATGSMAHKRLTGRRSIRAQFGRRYREPTAMAICAARRPELHIHLSGAEHEARRAQGNQLRPGHEL